jgi:hypothetical protein
MAKLRLCRFAQPSIVRGIFFAHCQPICPILRECGFAIDGFVLGLLGFHYQ